MRSLPLTPLAGTVTVTALGTGTACATGGTQISDGTTTSLACNGAQGPQGLQGIQGVPGPRLVLKTSTGQAVGIAYPHYDSPYGVHPYVIAGFASPPSMALISTTTGRLMATEAVYFSSTGCSGIPYLASRLHGVYAAEATGSTRIFAPISGTAVSVSFQSAYNSGSGCTATSGTQTIIPAGEVSTASYPFAVPFQLAFE